MIFYKFFWPILPIQLTQFSRKNLELELLLLSNLQEPETSWDEVAYWWNNLYCMILFVTTSFLVFIGMWRSVIFVSFILFFTEGSRWYVSGQKFESTRQIYFVSLVSSSSWFIFPIKVWLRASKMELFLHK